MAEQQALRIFISHSHRDNDFGVRLVRDLRQALSVSDEDVWYDAAGGLQGGMAWWNKIVSELGSRPIFIVILSPHSMDSKWVNDEINLAWNQKNSLAGKTIIPVLYRSCEVRDDLRLLQHISFIEPRPYEEALAELIEAIRTADSTTGATYSKQDAAKPTALTAGEAAETVKRYLEESRAIRLRDFVLGQVKDVREELLKEQLPVENSTVDGIAIQHRLDYYEKLSEMLVASLIVGCFWGEQPQAALWARCIEDLYPTTLRGGDTVWLDLRRYPALLTLYGAGIAAIAGGRYDNLAALFTHRLRNEYGESEQVAMALFTSAALAQGPGRLLPEMNGELRRTPTSDHLFAILKCPIEDLLGEHARYETLFDRFEYMLALVHADLDREAGRALWGQPGCFAWRRKFLQETLPELNAEVAKQGESWPPLQAGLFGGSLERFQTVQEEYDHLVAGLGWRWP